MNGSVVRLIAPVFAAFLIAAALSFACSDDDGGDGNEAQGGGISGEETLTLTARGTTFTTNLLAAPPEREMTFEFVNDTDGVRHNVAIFRTEFGGEPFFRIDPVVGKQTVQAEFTTPAIGNYYYRCEIHPEAMRGDLVVTSRQTMAANAEGAPCGAPS